MTPELRLERAEALLAKARSTTFAAERDVFAAGALTQFDAFLDGRPSAPPQVIDLRGYRPGDRRPSGQFVDVTL